MSSNTLKIVRGLAQAAANAYDGSHDERYSADGKARKIGLRREEGDPILDSRVMDGFKVKFSGDSICIHYQSDIKLKEVYAGGFESEIERRINEVKKFLQREYKAITGNSVTLRKADEPKVIVQSTSRVRSFVQATQVFNIGGIKADGMLQPSEPSVREITRKFLEQASTKRPQNDTRK
jgi:effector-binding domain-containing protein